MSVYAKPKDIRDREPSLLDEFDIRDVMEEDLAYILIGQEEIAERVEGLAAEITRDYRDRDTEFYPVCILKGASTFYHDLRGQWGLNHRDGFVNASRYGTSTTAEDRSVDIGFDTDPWEMEGRDVLIVEDIVDAGHTAKALMDEFEQYEPNSMNIVSLLDKPENREVNVDIEYKGFVIPDAFVVGYGLDYEEEYRGLKHIGVMDSDTGE